MKTKLLVPAVLAAAIGCGCLSAAIAASYSEAADTPKSAPAASTAKDNSTPDANDLHAQVATDVRSAGAARTPSPDNAAKSRNGPAKMFQLRDAAGG